MTERGKRKELIHKIRSGRIEAAVFTNSARGWSWHTVQIGRSYQTKHGDYRGASTYSMADLAEVARVAQLADHWVRYLIISGEESSERPD